MMKKHAFALLSFLVFSSSIHAEKINSFEINITVKQSGELLITEHIDYDFEQKSKHGVFRDIPVTVKNSGRIKNIGISNFEVLLDNEKVEWQQSSIHSSSSGKLVRLKIGSAETYVTGEHRYTISYLVKKGVLPASNDKNKDAIRWNVIGSGWEIPIANIRANIYLPESLNQSDIRLSTYTGEYGSEKTNATSRWINPKHLLVKVASLKPQEGATVELEYVAKTLNQSGLENVSTSPSDWFWDYWQWGVLAAFLLYLKKIFRQQGATNKRSVAVQYRPPNGMSLLEAGLVLDKSADSKDFAAAILEMAQLGFIEITQKDKRHNPVLTPTNKNTENLSSEQKYLLDFFIKDDSSYKISKTSNSQLREGLEHINNHLYDWVVSAGYMLSNPKKERRSFLKKTILYVLLPSIALMFYTFKLKYGPEGLVLLIFPIVFGTFGLFIFFLNSKISSRIFGLVFVVAGSIPFLTLLGKDSNNSSLLFSPLTMIMILILIIFFAYKKIGKYTPQGSNARTHLLGLKEFIKRVKQDEIKRRLETDPLFLDKLLPYALLFDEAEHWFSFYDELNVSSPSWYQGSIHTMQGFSSNVKDATTPPVSSGSGGGGFSGGGGSSGGGGGGGGGGSW